MESKLDKLISKYSVGPLHEAEGDLPELPPVGAPPVGMSPAPIETPAPEPEVREMSDEAYVSAVKTMIELLSYGLNAPEDVAHQEPVVNFLKMKDEVDKNNAFEVLQQIEDFLAQES